MPILADSKPRFHNRPKMRRTLTQQAHVFSVPPTNNHPPTRTHTTRPPPPFFFSPPPQLELNSAPSSHSHNLSSSSLFLLPHNTIGAEESSPSSLSSWDSCSVHNLFDKMSQWACVSAANLSCQASIINTQKLRNTPRCDAFSFKGSEFMAQSCRFLSPQAIYGRPRNGACPLKVCFL